MELPEAQKEFVDILNRVKDPATLNGFLGWVSENWFSGNSILNAETDAAVVVHGVEAEEYLETIAADLRALLPLEAQLPSETIVFSQVGPNSDCNPATTINVDGFLYDDKLVDKLSDEGKLPRNYCLRCGSRDVKPLTYISHSASKENLAYIFRTLLPDLSGKHLLDIGSRFGAVLFGAFAFSQAARISGVELNPDLAAISQTMINKYGMQSRVEVLTGDIRDFPQIVSSADVIIMHNVFEFFAPLDVQRELWIWLRQVIKRGAVLLTSPRLDESINHLNTGIVLEQWVEPVSAPVDVTDDADSTSSGPQLDLVNLYRVI